MSVSYSHFPEFHDGLLLGLVVRERSAAIFVQNESGQPYTISLRRVHTLRASEFYEGNIIFECLAVRDPAVLDDDLRELIRGRAGPAGIAHLQALMKAGTHELFVLTPSFGATVMALVGEIDITPGFVMPEDGADG